MELVFWGFLLATSKALKCIYFLLKTQDKSHQEKTYQKPISESSFNKDQHEESCQRGSLKKSFKHKYF